MFGLGRLFRREIRKAVKSAVSTPPKKPTTTTIKTQSVVKQVQVQSRTATQTTTQTTTQVSQSQIIRGKCHVIDGDTISIGKQKIRLAGIDAPELHNPYGKQAKYALIELCKGNYINAHLTGETSYDRVVAKCLLDDGRDLAAEMVKMELALDIPHFPNADYKHLETPNARRKLRWRPKKK